MSHTIELKYNSFTAYVHHNSDWSGDAEVVIIRQNETAVSHIIPAAILLAVGKAAYAGELRDRLIAFAEGL